MHTSKWAFPVAVLACAGLTASADDLTGTYEGKVVEAVQGAFGQHDRIAEREEVTVETSAEDKLVVRQRACELTAFVSGDGSSASLSHAPCDLQVGPYAGRVELFGTVSRNGPRLSMLLNGVTRVADERATYHYEFEGVRRE